MNPPFIIPGAEPFFFPGNRTGCLLVHGLTGAPKEMRWMGEDLSARGYSVLAVRLAGHATKPEDLIRSRYCDWLASVEDGFHYLSSFCDHVFIIGLSLGGILALTSSSYLPVAGTVAMSTPFTMPKDWRLNFVGLLKFLMPKVAKGPADWHNLEAARDHIEYPFYPTATIAQLKDLLAQMHTRLPVVQAPVLLIHSRNDKGVPPESMLRIYENLGSQDKQMLYVEDSGHVIPREPDRLIAFRAVHDFIQRCLSKTSQAEALHTIGSAS
jgi:carboxylesterase